MNNHVLTKIIQSLALVVFLIVLLIGQPLPKGTAEKEQDEIAGSVNNTKSQAFVTFMC